jgi:hypothetical protein
MQIRNVSWIFVIDLILEVVINATFSNISAISWGSVLVVEEAEYLERTTDHGQATGKLAAVSRVHPFLQFIKPGANPRCIGDRLV